jgi:DNA polymerase III alpha subunit (gram-positive type)
MVNKKVPYIDENGQTTEIARINHYIDPEIPIPPKITEITGINDSMVFGKPTIDKLFSQIKEFFGEDSVVSGYNVAKFDNSFMRNLYQSKNLTFEPITIDVIDMARDNIEKKETENFKLSTIAHIYGVDENLTFHNAMDDVIATKELVSAFYRQYKQSAELEDAEKELFQTNKKVVTTVSNIRYWQGYKGMNRIYIVTNLGEFYYDIRAYKWEVNSKNNPYSVDEIDMDSLVRAVFEKCKVSNEADFVKSQKPTKSAMATPKEIKTIRYWEKDISKTKTLHRLYVTTDVGVAYLDIDKMSWVATDNINVEVTKALCYEKTGATSDEEFSKYR